MAVKVAIMQPYLFPYIGYFQLIAAVDKFIFYDDVNYIKGGWINRNRILINNVPNYITVPLSGASSSKLINEVEIGGGVNKILTSIRMSYRKAPFFEEVFPLIEECLNVGGSRRISDLAIRSVVGVSNYLQLETKFEASSQMYAETKGLERSERIIAICTQNAASNYINALGGAELYDKDYFLSHKIKLNFLKSNFTPYRQFTDEFVAGLSIIDVLMFRSRKDISRMLTDYLLV